MYEVRGSLTSKRTQTVAQLVHAIRAGNRHPQTNWGTPVGMVKVDWPFADEETDYSTESDNHLR